MFTSDTICAPATAVGAGAISVIRLSGPDTFEIADKVVVCRRGSLKDAPGYSVRFGEIPGVDEVLVSVFRAPHSYTGEDSVEISCHASPYIVSEILRLLVDAGCRMAEGGEFTRRAYGNGKMDLAQAEAVADVISASSAAAHRVAMNQLKGKYSSELRSLRDSLVELTVLMELELDFSEEHVEFADRSQLSELLDKASDHIKSLAASFKDGNALKKGVPVAIVGAVNAGKSTLLNALVGEERAIVSDIEGTTRDTVEELMMIDGIQYRFIDTAGLRETDDVIENIGIGRSRTAMGQADVVLALIDGKEGLDRGCGRLREIRRCVPLETPIIVVINKIDNWMEYNPEDLLIGSQDDNDPGNERGMVCVKISARMGNGIDELRKAIAKTQEGRFSGDATLVTNLRHYEALVRALSSLEAVRNGLSLGIPTDLVAEDLRASISELNSIFGNQIGTEEVLGEIFKRFCIGK